MLQLTPEAAVRIVKMRSSADGGSDELFLRVWRDVDRREPGVRIAFVPRPREEDHVGVSQGVPLCVGEEVAEMLDGMVIDSRHDDHTPLYIRAAS